MRKLEPDNRETSSSDGCEFLVGAQTKQTKKKTAVPRNWPRSNLNSASFKPCCPHTSITLQPHTHTPWQAVICEGSGFSSFFFSTFLSLRGTGRGCSPPLSVRGIPAPSRGRELTLHFLPLSQPNSSSSEDMHGEAGSCTWVLRQHSSAACLFTLTDPVSEREKALHLAIFFYFIFFTPPKLEQDRKWPTAWCLAELISFSTLCFYWLSHSFFFNLIYLKQERNPHWD